MGGVCCGADNSFQPSKEDVERWQKKKSQSKGSIVPKVQYTPHVMSSEVRKAAGTLTNHKQWEKKKNQEDWRTKEAQKATPDKQVVSKAQEVLWVPHQGIKSYKELSEEFGSKNKKVLVRMASEKATGNYSPTQANRSAKAESANAKMKKSKSMKM
uniref:Uncharacterized protein n=1 Tax=Hemiselmis andersenii TaxID=464988 RepID=A0A6U2H4Z2_HEMAN|mmetsp:Transcript_39091/g.91315  ORF Transcript_39091/g.91315 Transcript_39091/m.91315 type:complete len:156 (+) Transcript_39091:211-678(+)